MPDSERLIEGAGRVRAPFVAAAVGFALTLGAFFPGLLDADSVAMVLSARTHAIGSDVHSPFVIAVWAMLDAVGLGVGAMVIAAATTFWLGLASIVATSGFGPRGRAFAVLAIGGSPALFSWLGVMNEDVLLVASLAFVLGAFAWSERTGSRRGLVVGLVGLVVASGIRHNAFFVTVPMAAVAAMRFGSASTRRLAFVAFLVAIGLGRAVVEPAIVRSFGGRPGHPDQQIAVQDLVGISLRVGRLLAPTLEIEGGAVPERRPATLVELADVYSPKGVVPLYWGAGPRVVWELEAPRVAAIRRAYLRAVVEHPLEYGIVRGRMIGRLFGLGRAVCHARLEGTAENELGIRTPDHVGFRIARAVDGFLVGRPLHRSILWLVLCGVGVRLARRGRLPWFVGAGALGGLVYGLALIVVSPVCSYRLTLPIVFVGSIVAAFGIDAWLRRRGSRS